VSPPDEGFITSHKACKPCVCRLFLCIACFTTTHYIPLYTVYYTVTDTVKLFKWFTVQKCYRTLTHYKGRIMALTDKEVDNAKVLEGKKVRKLSDGQGLYLLINKTGSKYWRYDYRFNDKRKTYTFGTYPDLPLGGKKVRGRGYVKGARDLLVEVKQLVAKGIDPVTLRKKEKQDTINAQVAVEDKHQELDNTFEKVTLEWYPIKRKGLNESYTTKMLGRIEKYVFPLIGSVPITELNKKQVADVIKFTVDAGVIDTAHRLAQYIHQILEYACDCGYIDLVPMGNVSRLIPHCDVKPMPALTDEGNIGELLRAIDNYSGTFVVCSALKLLPMLAVRGGEFRTSEWTEMDFEKSLWTIPAAHRKISTAAKKNPANFHLVPLSKQAVALLKDLHRMTGRGKHVFPSVRGDVRPMSENTITTALGVMGYKDKQTGHGFRAMFSTILNEKGFNPDAIERQLAHKERNAVRAAYNRSEYIEERINMMQSWADYLDKLRELT